MNKGGKKRILVAEDEENIRVAVTTVLEDMFEIDAVERGDTAFDLLESNRYDLVLSDVRMPGMDGIELFKAVKRIKPAQKFIFLTVSSLFADDPEASDILSRQADGFLGKPYRLPDLVALIEKVLSGAP